MEPIPPNILVVDDETEIGKLLKGLFDSMGCQTEVAENGDDAFRRIQKIDYDIILLDFNLPDFDGMDLLKQTRQIKPYIPVIIITGFGTVELAVNAFRSGAVDFFLKPINLELMKQSVQRILAKQQTSEQLTNLRQANQKLNDLHKVKTKFIEITNHELRTPVENISYFVQLLHNDKGKSSEADKQMLLNIIRHNAKDLKNIIDDMHDVLNETNNNNTLRLESFKVQEMLKELIQEFEPLTKKRSMQLLFNWPDEMIDWRGDRQKLQRAFRELLRNALEYTADGGRIRLICSILDDKLHIRISDNGMGIPVPEHDNIFRRFYRVHDTECYSASSNSFMGAGTGLGLFIAKSIVEAHNGLISLESTVGKGSTFTVELPMRGAISKSRLRLLKNYQQ